MENTSTSPSANYSIARNWLTVLISVLIIIATVYFITHHYCKQGSEYIKLTAKQVQRISSVLFADTAIAATDSISAAAPPRSALTREQDSLISNFLKVELNGDVDSSQHAEIMQYLSKVDKREAIAFLTDTRFKVDSYFFLTGSAVYVEIIFWVLFGVLGSLIFYVGDSVRKKEDGRQTGFDPQEIPYQVAKLFYAPLATIVLVLGYGLLSDQNLVDINAGKGMIIFAFVAGFYSGRMMNFLDRLKEVLLPGTEPNTAKPAPGAAPTNKTASVEVVLTLDNANLAPENEAEIAEMGWNKAVVILKSKDNTEIILEKPENDQGNFFSGQNIPFGDYVAKAVFNAETESGAIINLEGEQQVNIAQPQLKLNLQMKKTTSEG